MSIGAFLSTGKQPHLTVNKVFSSQSHNVLYRGLTLQFSSCPSPPYALPYCHDKLGSTETPI
jgi:hypothetical protein